MWAKFQYSVSDLWILAQALKIFHPAQIFRYIIWTSMLILIQSYKAHEIHNDITKFLMWKTSLSFILTPSHKQHNTNNIKQMKSLYTYWHKNYAQKMKIRICQETNDFREIIIVCLYWSEMTQALNRVVQGRSCLHFAVPLAFFFFVSRGGRILKYFIRDPIFKNIFCHLNQIFRGNDIGLHAILRRILSKEIIISSTMENRLGGL